MVVAPFDTYDVDIVPAFRVANGEFPGSFLTAHIGGGSSRISNPGAEYAWLKTVDAASAGKAPTSSRCLRRRNAMQR
jgi:hypothetical protein